MEEEFVGAKIALFYENQLLVFLRDDKPGLQFANMWDFPGGGRENGESPLECVQREVREEFGIDIEPSSVIWQRVHPSMRDPNKKAYFMVAPISKGQIDSVRFGDEGQRWQLMGVDEFLSRGDAVPHLKTRLQAYLDLDDSAI